MKYLLLLVSSLVGGWALIGGMLGGVSAQDNPYGLIRTLTDVVDQIRSDYVDEPDIDQAMAGAIRGMVEVVDPHGGYLDAASVAFYSSFRLLETPGVGVVLSKKFDYPVIVASVPGGPAALAGLGTGDAIESIDGETLREHNLVEVHQLLSGRVGTTVELNVIRRAAAAATQVTLTRAVVRVPPVEARMIGADVGYLKVPVFGPGISDEVAARVGELEAMGAAGLVVDLRNSAGGLRQEGYDTADLFLGAGVLGYLEGQTEERETFLASSGAAIDLPVAVLVNEGTADAAELLAGAIRDNDRGTLVGIRTFGIAAEQRVYPLEGGSALLLSYAYYYTPEGDEIQTLGVLPTVEVASAETQDPLGVPRLNPGGTDRQLDRALEILREGLAGRSAA
jgi:carboxyl-terminal processing protease